jgi:hypothetical protein
MLKRLKTAALAFVTSTILSFGALFNMVEVTNAKAAVFNLFNIGSKKFLKVVRVFGVINYIQITV